jgi:hypothetical protein
MCEELARRDIAAYWSSFMRTSEPKSGRFSRIHDILVTIFTVATIAISGAVSMRLFSM